MDENKKIPEHNGLNFGLVVEENLGGLTSLYQDKEILALPKIVDGSKDWMYFSSEREIQKTNFIDIMDCTTEAAMNAIHIFLDLLNGWKAPLNSSPIFPTENLSQRFTAEMSGTTPSGNTTQAVDHSIETDGVVDESFWHRTVDMNWAQYYATILESVKAQAKKFFTCWVYKTYLITPSHEMMMAGLDRGLLLVTVYAWAKGSDGLYHDYGYQPNHRSLVAGYVKGVKWLDRDSYPTDFLIDNNSTEQEFVKELDWNFKFGEVKLMVLTPAGDKLNSLLSLIYKLLNNFTSMLKGIIMMIPGGAKFKVKKASDGVVKKQEITTWQAAFASICDAFGVQTASPSDLSKIPDTKEFFPND